MDVIVRKVEGKITVVSGESRLDAQLNLAPNAVVKFLGSGKEVYVCRDKTGNLIEVNPGDSKQDSINSIEPCPLNPRDSDPKNDAVEKLLETTANEFFKGKNKAHSTPISYGELVWLMRSLLTAAQALPSALDPIETHTDLVARLWESDAASALTNQAARVIEQLSEDLQIAVNDRNAAWFQLEEAGIDIAPAEMGE